MIRGSGRRPGCTGSVTSGDLLRLVNRFTARPHQPCPTLFGERQRRLGTGVEARSLDTGIQARRPYGWRVGKVTFSRVAVELDSDRPPLGRMRHPSEAETSERVAPVCSRNCSGRVPVCARAHVPPGHPGQAMTPPSVIGDMRVMGHELSHVNEHLWGATATGTRTGCSSPPEQRPRHLWRLTTASVNVVRKDPSRSFDGRARSPAPGGGSTGMPGVVQGSARRRRPGGRGGGTEAGVRGGTAAALVN